MTASGFGDHSQADTTGTPARPPAGSVIPGVAVAVAVAAAAKLVHLALPDPVAAAIGDVIIAVALGIVVANVVSLPAALWPGIKFCVTTVLRAAIVLLGARLALGQVLAIGGEALVIIVVLMTTALIVAHVLARVTNTPAKVATLIGVGVSVCGNTAIVATAPVIGATDDDVATAVTVNTLFGMIAVFTYPLIARALTLDPLFFGTWAGTAVNDTSQVVAAGFAYGALAGQLATTVKLARNALMGFVIVGMGLLHGGVRASSPAHLLRKSFPLFVVGFLLMALANSLGVFSAIGDATGLDVDGGLATLARALLLVSLAGVGLSASVAGLRRAGWRPFVVGFAAAAITAAASFALISVIGPAGA